MSVTAVLNVILFKTLFYAFCSNSAIINILIMRMFSMDYGGFTWFIKILSVS